MNIYIDESGNTGDLIQRKTDLDFSKQNIFTLASVQISEDGLDFFSEKKIPELKRKYKVQGGELKSKQIFESKPKFLLELLDEMANNNIIFFIEVVDKKFYICQSIVTHQVVPPYFCSEDSKLDGSTQVMRNIFADLLTKHITNIEYKSFFKACQEVSESSLLESFDALFVFAEDKKNDTLFGDIYKGISDGVYETKDDYNLMKEKFGKENAVKKFLPIPDIGKKNQKIYLLPQISCLANIIAKTNFLNDCLNEIEFIHDEQKHFDDVLIDNIKTMYSLASTGSMIKTNNTDFKLKSLPKVTVDGLSENNIGLQIADVLAGFMMRYVKRIVDNVPMDEIYSEIFTRIINYQNDCMKNSPTVNFLTSITDMKKMGMFPMRNFKLDKMAQDFEKEYYSKV